MKGYTSATPLFDLKPATIAVEPVDPHVLASDVKRLNNNSLQVLKRLKAGPATKLELMGDDCGGLHPGARLHDLKEAGVIWKKEHVKGGSWLYTLISCPVELQ